MKRTEAGREPRARGEGRDADCRSYGAQQARQIEAEIAADFEEVSASGARYTRAAVKEIVLGRLAGTWPASLADGYRIEDGRTRALTPDLAHVSYILREPGRVTCRSTFYRRAGDRWQAVFHQGTVAQANAVPDRGHAPGR